METTCTKSLGKTNYNEMGPDRFTRSATVEGDKHEHNGCKLKTFRQISIDSGIADYEEELLKINKILDSEDDMSEGEDDFKDAEDFDEWDFEYFLLPA